MFLHWNGRPSDGLLLFIDEYLNKGNVGETCERRDGAHGYGLFRALRYYLELNYRILEVRMRSFMCIHTGDLAL